MAIKIEDTEGFKIMLETFFEYLEPEFDWEISEPYRFGDHPDVVGGLMQRDIESVTLVSAEANLSRKDCVKAFGETFVRAVEDHALKNPHIYCHQQLF